MTARRTSLDRRRARVAADRSEPQPYPTSEDVDHAKGGPSDDPPESGWTPPPDTVAARGRALAGRHRHDVDRPFGWNHLGNPHLTGAFANVVRERPEFITEATMRPRTRARRSLYRNRPDPSEVLCPGKGDGGG